MSHPNPLCPVHDTNEVLIGCPCNDLERDVYVTPGHPVKEGSAGCDCECGECLARRLADSETVVITHWRAVNEDGGIARSYSTRDGVPWHSRQQVEQFCDQYPQYHIEVWEQVFQVTPSEWRRVDDDSGILMAQAERAEAPFTDAQVEAINRYQQSGEMHPFTCRFRTQTAHLDYGEHDFGILVATTDRLRCRDCDYTQEWVWDFMARGSTGHDEYGLDPDKDWTGVAPCADPDHKWGPWVLSPVFANREDRFCTACGVMEMQYLSDGADDDE